jgi:hypothetical protein
MKGAAVVVKSRVAAAMPSVINRSMERAVRDCQFRPKIKAGMSDQDAAAAVDAAMTDWLNCLKGKRR